MTFENHFFLCTNMRKDGTGGGHRDADIVREQLKKNFYDGDGRFRINSSGCIGHCEHGPTLVAYPGGKWYTYLNYSDAELIVKAHLSGQLGPQELMFDGCF